VKGQNTDTSLSVASQISLISLSQDAIAQAAPADAGLIEQLLDQPSCHTAGHDQCLHVAIVALRVVSPRSVSWKRRELETERVH
jgi:hypothetical protein